MQCVHGCVAQPSRGECSRVLAGHESDEYLLLFPGFAASAEFEGGAEPFPALLCCWVQMKTELTAEPPPAAPICEDGFGKLHSKSVIVRWEMAETSSPTFVTWRGLSRCSCALPLL